VKFYYPVLVLLIAWAAARADTSLPASSAGNQDWNTLYPERIEALRAQGDAVRGEAAFVICQGCHRVGALGRADGSYPRLAGQHASVIIKQITDVQTGRRHNPKMLPFSDQHALTSQDIADIAVFLNDLPVPSNNGQGPGENLKRGGQLYEKDCAVCHGLNGQGSGEKLYPRVSGQHFKYLFRESQMIRDGSRRNANPEMADIIKNYTDDDIAAVTDFMSRLPVRP
jgi:cytochrome c553